MITLIPYRFTFHFVCLMCRRDVKSAALQTHIPCTTCCGEMIRVGRQFAAPRKKDDAAWKKLEWMIQNGWRGHGWPIEPKMNLREVQDSLAAQKRSNEKLAQEHKESQSLEQRRRAAKYNAVHSPTGQKRLKAELKRQEEYQTRVLAEAQSCVDSD